MTWCFSHGPYAESLKRAFPGVSTLLTNGASRFLFLKGKLRVLEALPKPLTQTERMNTMESRFFEPPREMKIGLKSRKFENSKVLYKNTYLSSGTWEEVRLLPEWQTVRTIFSLIVLEKGVTGPTKSPHTPNLGRWRPDISGVKTHAGKAQTQSDVST